VREREREKREGERLSRLQPRMDICPLFTLGCRARPLDAVLVNADPPCLAVSFHCCPLSTHCSLISQQYFTYFTEFTDFTLLTVHCWLRFLCRRLPPNIAHSTRVFLCAGRRDVGDGCRSHEVHDLKMKVRAKKRRVGILGAKP
jgi:hypothetical protein